MVARGGGGGVGGGGAILQMTFAISVMHSLLSPSSLSHLHDPHYSLGSKLLIIVSIITQVINIANF